MLTVEELFALPPDGDWRYFDTVLLPRLIAETHGTDDGCVMNAEGERVCVIAAVSDGIAHALLSERTLDVQWRSFLLENCHIDREKPRCGYENAARTLLRTPVTPRISEKCKKILEDWLDIYAEMRDPLQHFPKLKANDIEEYIIKPLARMPNSAFDGVIMRLADRMLELGLRDCYSSAVGEWSCCSMPGPAQQNLLFLARGNEKKAFMDNVFYHRSQITDGGILAEAFLTSLIREAATALRNHKGMVHFERSCDTIDKTMAMLLDDCPTVVSHDLLWDLTREALIVWLKAIENSQVLIDGYYLPREYYTLILRQLVLTYHAQMGRCTALRTALVPDQELMLRARALMDSWPAEVVV